MRDKFYYLVASLPNLKFSKAPPMSSDAFLDECGKWLNEKEMAVIKNAAQPRGVDQGYTDTLDKWRTFFMQLINGLVEYREAKKKGEEKRPSGTAGKVIDQADPLQAEVFFENVKWEFLEELSIGHYFDLDRLMTYYLQLLILERLQKFNKDKGEKRFYEMCEVKYDK